MEQNIQNIGIKKIFGRYIEGPFCNIFGKTEKGELYRRREFAYNRQAVYEECFKDSFWSDVFGPLSALENLLLLSYASAVGLGLGLWIPYIASRKTAKKAWKFYKDLEKFQKEYAKNHSNSC